MEKIQKQAPSVFAITAQILQQLDRIRDTGSGKALLANLRNSIGQSPSRMAIVWPLFFECLPAEYLSQNGSPTKEEQAILHTLQLYAIYQQGCSHSVFRENEEISYKNLGGSLADLRTEQNREAADRRFRILITATDYSAFVYRVRQILQLLKSRTKSKTTIHFPRLAEDFYWFLRGYDEEVRFQWAQSYYRRKNEGEENE